LKRGTKIDVEKLLETKIQRKFLKGLKRKIDIFIETKNLFDKNKTFV